MIDLLVYSSIVFIIFVLMYLLIMFGRLENKVEKLEGVKK
jgi:hypothetical protein